MRRVSLFALGAWGLWVAALIGLIWVAGGAFNELGELLMFSIIVGGVGAVGLAIANSIEAIFQVRRLLRRGR